MNAPRTERHPITGQFRKVTPITVARLVKRAPVNTTPAVKPAPVNPAPRTVIAYTSNSR